MRDIRSVNTENVFTAGLHHPDLKSFSISPLEMQSVEETDIYAQQIFNLELVSGIVMTGNRHVQEFLEDETNHASVLWDVMDICSTSGVDVAEIGKVAATSILGKFLERTLLSNGLQSLNQSVEKPNVGQTVDLSKFQIPKAAFPLYDITAGIFSFFSGYCNRDVGKKFGDIYHAFSIAAPHEHSLHSFIVLQSLPLPDNEKNIRETVIAPNMLVRDNETISPMRLGSSEYISKNYTDLRVITHALRASIFSSFIRAALLERSPITQDLVETGDWVQWKELLSRDNEKRTFESESDLLRDIYTNTPYEVTPLAAAFAGRTKNGGNKVDGRYTSDFVRDYSNNDLFYYRQDLLDSLRDADIPSEQ